MHKLVTALICLGPTACLTPRLPSTTSDSPPCDAGDQQVDGVCVQLCHTDRDCAAGEQCAAGVCNAVPAAKPEADADPPPQGDNTDAAITPGDADRPDADEPAVADHDPADTDNPDSPPAADPSTTDAPPPEVAAAVCGDAVKTAPEACEDGNLAGRDGCDENCQIEVGFKCITDAETGLSYCGQWCGNGRLSQGETVESCDDGNREEGDGCNSGCAIERGWACSGEPSVCAPVCGDDRLLSPEGCDDGNQASGDGCSSACQVEHGFICTDGPCTSPCGDGIIASDEVCDDGNADADDGCAPDCRVDAGWTCKPTAPSACTPQCGDGVLLGGEMCDDANTNSADGCDVACQEEPGWQCSGIPSECYVPMVLITAPPAGVCLRGLQTVTWEVLDARVDDVELWLADDSGAFAHLGDALASATVFEFDTTGINCQQCQLMLVPVDTEGVASRPDISARFVIDNIEPLIEHVTVPAMVSSQTTIRWEGLELNPGTVRIELYNALWSEPKYRLIIADAADTGAFNWDAQHLADGNRIDPEGAYRLRLTRTDRAGNLTDPAYETLREFRIDLQPPAITLTSPRGGEIWSGEQNITWTPSTESDVSVRIELFASGAWAEVATGVADTGRLSLATTAFADTSVAQVRITPTDAAGNVGAAQVGSVFGIDNSAPTLNFTNPIPNFVKDPLPIAWNATDANLDRVLGEIRSSGGGIVHAFEGNATGPYRFDHRSQSVPEGNYTVRLTAKDRAGHTTPVVSTPFVIDRTAPLLTVSNPLPNTVIGTSITVTFTVAEPNLSRVVLQTLTTCSSSMATSSTTLPNTEPFLWSTLSLSEGPLCLRIAASDRAGNSADARIALTIDRTPPTVAWRGPLSGGRVSGSVDIAWETNDTQRSQVEIWAQPADSNGNWQGDHIVIEANAADTGTYRWDTAKLADGNHELLVWPIDAAGNRAKSSPRSPLFELANGSWGVASANDPLPTRRNGLTVWTGREVLVFGGSDGTRAVSSGWRYDPRTQSQRLMSTASRPSPRQSAIAVWTGREAIVWGGHNDAAVLNDGAAYDPVTDAWRVLPDAPLAARTGHTAVWTGAAVLVWGGRSCIAGDCGGSGYFADGAAYDPRANTWTTLPAGALGARHGHTAIFTGRDMLVWGGNSWGAKYADGAAYDPRAQTWTALSATGAPSARSWHQALWTGTHMLVFGGVDGNTRLGDGAAYDPAAATWATLPTAGGPDASRYYSALWTGREMLVVSTVASDGTPSVDGRRFDPQTNAWYGLAKGRAPTLTGFSHAVWTGRGMLLLGGAAPGGEYQPPRSPEHGSWITIAAYNGHAAHSATWAERRLIIWGGSEPAWYMARHATYDPAANAWTAIDYYDERHHHSAVWTGREHIAWGGDTGALSSSIATGFLYDPQTKAGEVTATTNSPAARTHHTAIWTGREMIVWGGYTRNTSDTNTGARLAVGPSGWVWAATSTASAPPARRDHQAFWTGRDMLVWGKSQGGRYSPGTDSWQDMNASGDPRGGQAVWTGRELLAWSGVECYRWGCVTADLACYDPYSDTWTPERPSVVLTQTFAPTTATWTGREAVFISGTTAVHFEPLSACDGAWTTSVLPAAPDGPAVWSGREIIVWGLNGGYRYAP